MFRDREGLTRVMSADKNIGELINRIANDINESPLKPTELEDVAQLLEDITQYALDKGYGCTAGFNRFAEAMS